jgi:predicted membrane protein
MLRQDRNAIWGLLIILFGFILLMDSLGFIDFNFWHLLGKLWPLALIIIGLIIIFERKKRVGNLNFKINIDNDKGEKQSACESSALGILGDIRIAGLTQAIGDIDKSLLLGDIVVDLTGAKLATGENNVALSVLIGDIDIIVPTDFPLSVDLGCLIGSVACDSQKSDGFGAKIHFADDNFDSSSSKLIITAKALIGDISVIRKVK